MKQLFLSSSPSQTPRSLDLTRYDRFPELRDAERDELNHFFSRGTRQILTGSKLILQRLLEPVEDVLALIEIPNATARPTRWLMCVEMGRRQTPFWVWSVEVWREIMGSDKTVFAERYGWNLLSSAHAVRARSQLPALIYFLLPHLDMGSFLDISHLAMLAERVFGKTMLTETVQRILTVLEGWGYHTQHDNQYITNCVCYLLLVNRSPYLEDLSSELLELVDETCMIYSVKHNILKVSRALQGLGILTKQLSASR